MDPQQCHLLLNWWQTYSHAQDLSAGTWRILFWRILLTNSGRISLIFICIYRFVSLSFNIFKVFVKFQLNFNNEKIIEDKYKDLHKFEMNSFLFCYKKSSSWSPCSLWCLSSGRIVINVEILILLKILNNFLKPK